MLVPFAQQSRPGAHSGERLINWFLQPNADGTAATLGRTGLTEHVDLGGAVYAVDEMGGNLYAVTATAVWKIVAGVATQVGTISGNNDIRTAASISELAIVTNGNYYICNGTTTTAYTTGSVTSPIDVAFTRGYFAVIGTADGRTDALTVSGLDDGTTFGALDYVFAESAPDGLTAILAYRNELALIGTTTVEFYYLSGAVDFPFSANTGAVMERGCLNGRTVAKDDNSFFWLGEDRIIYRNGATPQVVSSLEMSADIASRDVDRCFTCTDRGHKFYVVRMLTGATWVMNIATGAWQEFSSEVDHQPWIATCSIICAGVQYFGTTTGKVCTQSGYNDDGKVIRAEMVTPLVDNGGEYFSVNKLHINFDTGNETHTTTPQVALEVTRNGKDWTNEKWRPLQNLGGYKKRASWHGLGAGRFMQGRIWITDETKRDMIGGSYG